MAIPELNRNIRMKCEPSGGWRKHLFRDFLIWCWKQQEKWVEIDNLLHPFCLHCKLLRPQHPPDYHSAFISLTFRETLTRVPQKKIIISHLEDYLSSHCCTPLSVCSFCSWVCFLSSFIAFYWRKESSLGKKECVFGCAAFRLWPGRQLCLK